MANSGKVGQVWVCLLKKETLWQKFFSVVEWSSEKLWKMVSADDVKTTVKK